MNNNHLKIYTPLSLVMLLTLLFSTQAAWGQWHFGGYVGPGIQTVTTKEPTITDAYRPRLLPQIGGMAAYYFRNGVSIRGGLGYDLAGTQYQRFPILDHSYNSYWVKGRIDYLKAFVGLGYGGYISERLFLEGFADLAVGTPMFIKFKEVEDGEVVYQNTSRGLVYSNYLGLNLGLGLKLKLSSHVWLRFSPTFQTQFNRALGSGGPDFHFVGFVPRFEMGYNLPSKIKNMHGRRGNKTLYIDDI